MNFLYKLFNSNRNDYKIQSFTFYIPAPPHRSSGYREKQFDKIFYEFINKGFKIISLNTQSHTGQNQSGMWVVCVVQATNKKAEELNLDEFFHDQIGNKSKNEKVNGLYYIDENN